VNLNNGKIKVSDVRKLFIQFVKEEVHLGDFDQGQPESDTVDVFKRWWKKKENKIKRLSRNEE
jgi:hypothetical protein